MKTPTLEDVAARAGVSTATVSRCLNAPEKVVERTRLRVMEAVRDLGYAPNFSARALAEKRTRTIGAVIPTMENAIFAEGLQAFQDVLQGGGYTLLIASSGYDPKVEEDQIRTLVARGAEGLLLVGYDRAPAIAAFLEAQNVPSVIAWAHDTTQPGCSVGFDNRAAMRALVTHALELGHRRVAMISAPLQGNDRARERHAGVLAALKERGLELEAMVETPYDLEGGGEALQQVLRDKPETTLVVCGNDVLAAGALEGARIIGLDVPADISITGFDDIALARIVRPALATVRVPHRDMGEAAARAVVSLVETGGAENRILETQMCPRASLGTPKRPS